MTLPARFRLRAALLLLCAVAGVRCSDNSAIGPGAVIAVRVVPDSLTLDLGQQSRLRAFPIDADSAFLAQKHPRWSTQDGGIAMVDDTGLVTGVALGTTSVDATVDGISGTVAITVSDPEIAFGVDTAQFVGAQLGPDPAAQSIPVRTARSIELTGMVVGTIGYGAGASGWLQASLDQPTTPASLLLAPSTAGLAPGSYTAQVPITAGNSSLTGTLEVSLTVGAGPTIAFSTPNVDLFAIPSGTDPTPVAVQIDNAGGGTLSGLSVGTIVYGAGASGWITDASLDQTTAPATLTVTGAVGSLVGGTYTATIPVSSPAAVNSPQQLQVTFTVTNQATIQLSSPTAGATAAHLGSDPASTGITITNGSGGTLGSLAASVSYGPGASGWLSATLDVTTAPATLTLQPTTGTLGIGSYSATVSITSPVAVNSPQTVTYTFRVATSFVADVQPVFNSCSACHDGGTAFPLPNPYPYSQLVNQPSGCVAPDLVTIQPFFPDSSYLYRLLAGTTTCSFIGYTQMPPGGLPQATIDLVRQWILDGAPNN